MAPTFAASRWQLTMRESRALMQINALNTSVATGLVIGMSPRTTPMGSAISVSAVRPSLPTTPTPGFPTSDCATSRLANRFLFALSGTQPMPVSATVAAASSSAWPAIFVASAVIRPSTLPSCQPAMLSWAATDRATSASTAGSGSFVKVNSSRSLEKTRDSQCSIMTPVAGSLSHTSLCSPRPRSCGCVPVRRRRSQVMVGGCRGTASARSAANGVTRGARRTAGGIESRHHDRPHPLCRGIRPNGLPTHSPSPPRNVHTDMETAGDRLIPPRSVRLAGSSMNGRARCRVSAPAVCDALYAKLLAEGRAKTKPRSGRAGHLVTIAGCAGR